MSESPLDALKEEVDRTVDLYERLLGHWATATRATIHRCGYGCALSQIVTSADLQKGFKVLRDGG